MRAMREIKVSSFTRFTHTEKNTENRHSNYGDGEPKYAFPTDHLNRWDSMLCHDKFLEHELCGREELGECNQQDTNDNSKSIGCLSILRGSRSIIVQRSR